MAVLSSNRAGAAPYDGGAATGESLLSALATVARHFGLELTPAQLRRDHRLQPGQPTIAQLLNIARASGLRASSRRLTWRELAKLSKGLPAIVPLRNGHAMVLREVHPTGQLPCVVLDDPNAGGEAPLTLDEARFTAAWTGEILLFRRDYRLGDEAQPFGMWLLIGQILHDRRLMRDTLIAAVALSFLALAPILFWRVLIDRVLYYGSLGTLSVLCGTMLILVAFETAFGYLRRHFVLYMSERLDVKFSTYIFDRVLQLPIDFFERTPVGQVWHDMSEFNKIRDFVTTHLFSIILDVFIVLVFFPVMFVFSPLLTFAIFGVGLLIFAWIIMRLPELRRKSSAVIRAETEKGTFLIETLHGMRTVKAMALYARRRHEWDGLVSRAVQRHFDEGRTTNMVETAALPLERAMTSGAFALAVYLAITTQQQVFVGALIAFMMLAQRAAQPLIQLSKTVTKYDEAQLAVLVVGKLVNRAPEEGRSKNGIRTPIVGRVEFSDVRFRYLGTSTPALDNVSFAIPEGTVFGIMGRSGSGKTTVTRLLQMFHGNYEGLIKVDGVDLRQYDIDHLRGSFGVVMQENFLFSGAIRDTIASGKPDASFDEVVMAARLAGAEEFIERLQRGYDTHIYEGSPNLSGGQRQRLAIARALITNPRILILDEATSALDAESEAIVNANLMRIAEGRTLIIISHRLSSLIAADAILVLERGRVYDMGTHGELVERCDIYSNLWHQQNQHLLSKPSHEVVPFRA